LFAKELLAESIVGNTLKVRSQEYTVGSFFKASIQMPNLLPPFPPIQWPPAPTPCYISPSWGYGVPAATGTGSAPGPGIRMGEKK